MTDRRAFGFGLAAAAAGATPTQAADDVREANKRTVLAFYDAALNRSNIDEAAACFGPHFTNHNPRSKDGIEGFRALMQDVQKQFPQAPQLAPGTLLYALHAADGTPIMLTDSREAAIANAWSQELETVSVH